MPPKDLKFLLSRAIIASHVKRLGEEITKEYQGKNLVIVGVLKGALFFMADLLRHIQLDTVEIDFVRLHSYDGSESTGTVHITKDIDSDITGKDVLIIEEIIDTGRTLEFLKKRLLSSHPRSVKLCVLFDKRSQRVTSLEPDYIGQRIENRFVVGYGLDFLELYRNLPDIYYIQNPDHLRKQIQPTEPPQPKGQKKELPLTARS